ncbi:Flp family type IVb pilin [Ramlibacter sp. RBP-2]|uniref:Flp family type IVb pilin n=1 Tax=Ramlibacter lithotrophicus TaxID=2606681 RepID=A0A7X6I6F6_9BURK|nr:Flp family type IVb pilin [Ramlibacter lithotrophicus]NKE66039.1 Flp family type IVb pilin [Ramlibacter lithotrophicus]
MSSIVSRSRSLAAEEDGAQVIEYALIVAVVALGLLLALQPLADSGWWGTFLTRLSNCFTGTCA